MAKIPMGSVKTPSLCCKKLEAEFVKKYAPILKKET
jgi:hypothetical protein